jgi:hypothetical protein
MNFSSCIWYVVISTISPCKRVFDLLSSFRAIYPADQYQLQLPALLPYVEQIIHDLCLTELRGNVDIKEKEKKSTQGRDDVIVL